jgi:hypothetical protein
VKTPKARIIEVKKGAAMQVAVKVVNSQGLSSWDWAHATIKY